MKKKVYSLIIMLFTLFLFNYNVDAATSATFTCSYYGNNYGVKADPAETIIINFKAIGDQYQMQDCTRIEGSIISKTKTTSCKSYTFLIDKNYKADLTCPSSIDVDFNKEIITWVANYNGNFKHIAGTRTNYIENSGYKATCLDFHKKSTCLTSPDYACIWSEKYKFCNTDNLVYVKCGNIYDIPEQVPKISSFVVNLLKIATPIVLIIVSIISLLKSLASSKEDEIKKAQTGLIRKLIAAALVFFVVSIVQFVILKVADSKVADESGKTEADYLSTCLSCFLNNDCGDNLYYKTTVAGEDVCTTLGGKTILCDSNPGGGAGQSQHGGGRAM